MKNIARLFLLTLMAILGFNASILTETKTRHVDRYLKLQEDVVATIKAVPGLDDETIQYITDRICPTYNPKEKDNPLQICVGLATDEDKSMKIEFRSPSNIFELEFSNLEIKWPNDINSGDYLKPDIDITDYAIEFSESLKELVIKPELRKAVIFAGIKAGIEKAGAKLVRDIAGDVIEYTYNEKPNSIKYGITGDHLSFSTDFFNDSIDLNIPVKNFIQMETQKLVEEIVDHLFQMQEFALSDGNSAAQSIKELNCDKIWADEGDKGIWSRFRKRMEVNELDIGKTKVESGAIVTVKGSQGDVNKRSMTLKCDVVKEGAFNLIKLTGAFKVNEGNIEPYEQTFLGRSLYNLMPVVASFLNDLATFTIRSIATKNNEESLSVNPIADKGQDTPEIIAAI